jgi:hypothetical protein
MGGICFSLTPRREECRTGERGPLQGNLGNVKDWPKAK